MYDILIYVLKAWSQKQDSSLAYLGRDRRGWAARGGEGCSVELLYYLFTYLHYSHIYNFIRCRSVALYLVVFVMGSVSTNISNMRIFSITEAGMLYHIGQP